MISVAAFETEYSRSDSGIEIGLEVLKILCVDGYQTVFTNGTFTGGILMIFVPLKGCSSQLSNGTKIIKIPSIQVLLVNTF